MIFKSLGYTSAVVTSVFGVPAAAVQAEENNGKRKFIVILISKTIITMNLPKIMKPRRGKAP